MLLFNVYILNSKFRFKIRLVIYSIVLVHNYYLKFSSHLNYHIIINIYSLYTRNIKSVKKYFLLDLRLITILIKNIKIQ